MSLILKRDADDMELVTTFLLDMSRVLPVITSNNSNTPRNYRYTYSTPPVINIVSEGKWQSHYEWSDDEVISCFSSSCAVNLTASGTFSFENMPLKYVWTFGKYGQKTQKNPSTVIFETGRHMITLFVSDSNGMNATKEITVLVPEVSTAEVVSKNIKNSMKKSEKSTQSPEASEGTPWEFSPPELILQNPERWTGGGDHYVCMADTPSCSVNFSFS